MPFFKRERYLPIIKTMFLNEIYKMLWNLTIVGGIIKNYSYKMVQYIIAENPNTTLGYENKISYLCSVID
jgi:hypothetical protein